MLGRPMVRRGRPGLLGTMARTAVIAGTASATTGAVHGWRGRRQQQAAQEEAARQAAHEQRQPQQSAPPPAPSDLAGKLQQLADLHASGALTDQEYAAAKAQVLG
ncbi:SHOCT domain-containing protein [Phytohabitans houttuyneae]|uniref:SHOCT domain-containing protein n=1 Tax=Phytohabitans houttuyneae TaxID=1076126 RepID=A0A6V8JZ59_9ACTN|nr:SHOCT domain-containing protein [Phytohabitans houttuyneae]GFJ78083.1 hypothetical protein Phou_022630 [Phytohabitans houttuyneae]